MKIFIQLFFSFFKVGLFTFGGGYAMLPLLKAEVVQKQKWITEDELLDYFSIGQCTPGIIAVNVSTFCGYKLRGILGAVVSTFAVVLPSVIIISLIASILKMFVDNQVVAHAFSGIRVGVCALILVLVIDMCKKVYKQSQNKKLHFSILLVSAVLLVFTNISAVFVVLTALAIGFVPNFVKVRKK